MLAVAVAVAVMALCVVAATWHLSKVYSASRSWSVLVHYNILREL